MAETLNVQSPDCPQQFPTSLEPRLSNLDSLPPSTERLDVLCLYVPGRLEFLQVILQASPSQARERPELCGRRFLVHGQQDEYQYPARRPQTGRAQLLVEGLNRLF